MRKSRRGGRQDYHHHHPSNTSQKPLLLDQTSLALDSDSSSHHSISQPICLESTATDIHLQSAGSNFVPRTSKPNNRNPNWVPRNNLSNIGEGSVNEQPDEVGQEVVNEQQYVEEQEGKASNGQEGLELEDNIIRIEKGDESESGKDIGYFMSGLKELHLGAELEPKLLEEQMRINDQSQEDELLALESIYGENVFNFDKRRGLRYFQIHIHIEATSEIAITTKFISSTDPKRNNNISDDVTYSFKVQYLPPILLTCLLPKSYPSHLPPHFTLSAKWLNTTRISTLCSKLDSIWMEQLNQEVIYQWVEWLHSCSLSYLGFEEEIILGPYGIKQAEDKRAISEAVGPEVDIPFIKSHNDDRLHENFSNSFHECCICFSEYAGTDFIKLPCQHFFCWKCMKTYCDMHAKEGTINKLQCPTTKCGGMIPPSLLKGLLGNEEYERWESLMLTKTLEAMSDVVYCPRCETPCIGDEDQHAQCSKCFFSFCTLCHERRHVGLECMSPELKLEILKERQNSTQLKNEQKQKELDKINEILSVKEILRDSKQCPACNMAIYRTEGCNKMICTNCGQYFCYRCNKAITGYDHFSEETCKLFTQEMIQAWEEQLNRRQLLGQAQAAMFADHGQLCPNCRQFNGKVGNNNHIFCWACQIHYCYLCKKIVRRTTQHYGPKGCKQHTEG